MFVVGWVDPATQTTSGISIPCLLSFLAYQDIHATVQGIDSFAPKPTPPINLLFQVYHFMIVMGPALAGIGVLAGLMFLWRRRLFESRFVLSLLVLTVFVGEATITAGWWTAEVGRQPWVVYDVLMTADGVSPVLSGVDVLLSLGMFLVLYGLLLVLFLYLLNRRIQEGPEPLEEVETVPMSSLPDTFRDIFSRRPRAADAGESE
jgi:cytochrome d ubiquinol oxidase subunit I